MRPLRPAERKKERKKERVLDWEKAVDKIQHDKLILALERLGFLSQ